MSWARNASLDQSFESWRAELRSAAGPLRDHLADAVADSVATGALSVGMRLPAERQIAESLGISRGTVVAALDQLAERGILERRVGSGTYVRSSPVTAARLATPSDQALVDSWMSHDSAIDLSVSSPIDPPTDLFAGVGLGSDDLLGTPGQHGYAVYGEPEMRQVAADRLSRCGLASHAEDVVITSGAQQALQVAVRSLVKPGSRVFVESPTYPGLLAILRQAGAVAVTLRTDAEGVQPADLARAVEEHGPGMLATCSIVSNPGASVLSPQRRAALLDVITRHDIVVLEDLTVAELLLDEVPVAAPLTADPRVRGVTVGSASKLLWGGLRVGWLRTSETWLYRMGQAKALEDFGTSPITQRMAAALLRRLDEQPGWLDARKAELRARRDLLVQLLHEHLPSWGVRSPVGGLSLWVHLPSVDTGHFANVADRHRVHVMPGQRCGVGDAYNDHLRLCFDRDPQQLTEAVMRLVQAQQEVSHVPRRLPVAVGP